MQPCLSGPNSNYFKMLLNNNMHKLAAYIANY